MVTNDSIAIVEWYRHYKNGVLLKGGGLLEQPNFYLEVMSFLQSRE